MATPVRKRRFPIIGAGAGVWSHVHIEDATAPTGPRSTTAGPGTTTLSTTSPRRCGVASRARSALGAKPPGIFRAGWGGWQPVRPRHWMMTEARGGWTKPTGAGLAATYAGWRQGFAQGLR